MIAASSWLTLSLLGAGAGLAALLYDQRARAAILTAPELLRSIAIMLMLGLLLDHGLGLLGGSLALQYAVGWAGLAVLGAGLFAGAVAAHRAPTPPAPAAVRIELALHITVLALGVSAAALAIMGEPLFAWDARSVWFFQAKAIYLDGGFWMSDFWTTTAYDWTHKHYPKLLPLLAARAADIAAPGWNEYAPKIALVPLFAAGAVGVAAVAGAPWRSFLILAAAVLIIGTHVWDGYADGLLALFGTASVGALIAWIAKGDRRDLILATAAAALALCLKDEGKLFFLALLPLAGLGLLRHRRDLSARDAAVALLLLPYLAWLWLSQDINPERVIAGGTLIANAAAALLDPAATAAKIAYLVAAAHRDTYLTVMGASFAVIAVFAGRRSFQPLHGAVALALSLGLAAVYLGTPADFEWHVSASLQRVAMLPTLLLWAGAVTTLPPFTSGTKPLPMPSAPALPPDNARLSILIPVYNERATLARVLEAVCAALPAVEKEIILVDDRSSDGTTDLLKSSFGGEDARCAGVTAGPGGEIMLKRGAPGREPISFRVRYHERNRGKGGALRTAMAAVTGDIVVIQDADLEYDPADWAVMYDLVAVKKVADVVYGSRFFGRPHRSLFFHHYMANRVISTLFNLIYNQTLTDIEVCYKMFTRAVLDSLALTCNDFGIEVEISAQIARQRKLRIYETAISYYGRTYDEGKKINWRDGVKALWYLVKFRF